MIAKLEPKGLQYRGVEIIAETDEEDIILLRIWSENGRPVSVTRNENHHRSLHIAPIPKIKGSTGE